jgi:hypothetical protein
LAEADVLVAVDEMTGMVQQVYTESNELLNAASTVSRDSDLFPGDALDAFLDSEFGTRASLELPTERTVPGALQLAQLDNAPQQLLDDLKLAQLDDVSQQKQLVSKPKQLVSKFPDDEQQLAIDLDNFKRLEATARDAWRTAREEELRVAAVMDAIADARTKLLAIFSEMLSQRRTELLKELNDALKGVSSSDSTNLTDQRFGDLFDGKYELPTNTDETPDSLPREIPANMSHWAGYKLYIAKELHLEVDLEGVEHWSFTDTPMTPRQWLASPLCQDSYQEVFTTSTASVPEAIAQTKRTLKERNDDFLDEIGVKNELLRQTMHDMTAEQAHVNSWWTPFAFEFGVQVP